MLSSGRLPSEVILCWRPSLFEVSVSVVIPNRSGRLIYIDSNATSWPILQAMICYNLSRPEIYKWTECGKIMKRSSGEGIYHYGYDHWPRTYFRFYFFLQLSNTFLLWLRFTEMKHLVVGGSTNTIWVTFSKSPHCWLPATPGPHWCGPLPGLLSPALWILIPSCLLRFLVAQGQWGSPLPFHCHRPCSGTGSPFQGSGTWSHQHRLGKLCQKGPSLDHWGISSHP